MGENRIFIAEADDQIVAFAVISIVEENWARVGVVVELQCLDSSSFSDLIQAITKYCAGKKADVITIYPPPLASIHTVLRRWEKVEHGVMMVKPISFLPVLRQLLLRSGLRKIIQGKTITLFIDGEAIRMTADEVQTIGNHDFRKGDMTISLSSKILIGIMFNQLNPLLSWLAGKIRIRRVTDVPLALNILKALKLNNSMYVSLGDIF